MTTSYTDLDGKITKSKVMRVNDNAEFEFTFMPEIFVGGATTWIPDSNIADMNLFINTPKWNDFVKYNFDEFRSFTLPFYTPEMYYTEKVRTYLWVKDSKIMIAVGGTIKKYPLNQVKQMMTTCGAMNKTWSDDAVPLTTQHIYELVQESFYHSTQEGGVLINDIGLLSLGEDTCMDLIIKNI